jgi:hypothetical protein
MILIDPRKSPPSATTMPFPAFDMAEYNSPQFSHYVDAHEAPKGAGDARPTAIQIVKDNHLEGKLHKT